MTKRGLSVNDLIKHMQDIGINIKYNQHSIKYILYTGYFHGYKAYRLILKRQGTTGGILTRFSRAIHIKNFQEIKLLYDLDNYLKLLFYPYIMQFGTAIKSYLIYTLVTDNKSDNRADFASMFSNHTILNKLDISLYDLKKCSTNIRHINKYTKKLSKRCNSDVYTISSLARAYKRCKYAIYDSDSESSILLLNDYKNKSEKIPIWATLEFITFGNLMFLIKFLLPVDRKNLQKNMGTYCNKFNPDGKLLYKHMNLLRYLRNSVAHNSVIFDCRFNIRASKEKRVRKQLQQATGISVDFQHIEDYIILIFYYLFNVSDMNNNAKHFKITIKSFISYIRKFKHNTYKLLGNKLGKTVFDSIFGTNVFVKMKKLLKLLNKYDDRNLIVKIFQFFY